jgi:hypothetical protein
MTSEVLSRTNDLCAHQTGACKGQLNTQKFYIYLDIAWFSWLALLFKPNSLLARFLHLARREINMQGIKNAISNSDYQTIQAG